MDRTTTALDYFSSGYSCSQSVLAAFSESYGLDGDLAVKVAGAFGGGMSHTNQACGAVTGALMVLGLQHGAVGEAKQHMYEIAKEFVRRFTARHGTISCTQLLGYDLGDPQQRAAAKEQDLFSSRCCMYVQDAVRILEEML